MSVFVTNAIRFFALAAALLASSGAQADSRMQRAADEAALAAVQVLAAGGVTADAIAIAQQTAAAIPGVSVEVTASPDLIVRVKLSALNAKDTANSTARYVPPDLPATFAWASRQRFVTKPSPFTVGSACVRDCDANPLH